MYLLGDELIINLYKVNSIVHNKEDNTIQFRFAYRTEEVEYSEEVWEMILNELRKSEKDKRVTFPKPLDVKVVNK